MPDKDALYVYGIMRKEYNLRYLGKGLNKENVYTLKEGNFSALVHDCEEKPYNSEDPNKIKELIIAHNKILNKAMEDFRGVIPLPFNTIIKKNENSAEYNLKKWLNDNKERLERIWNKIEGKREYGIRIYYNQDKLIQEASDTREINEIEKSQEGKSEGLSYLLQGKVKSKRQEIFQNKVNELKKGFYDEVKEAVEGITLNPSRISLEEEKDLLLSLSVLVEEKKVDKIKEILEKKEGEWFSFQLAGPFAPYSFVENETYE